MSPFKSALGTFLLKLLLRHDSSVVDDADDRHGLASEKGDSLSLLSGIFHLLDTG